MDNLKHLISSLEAAIDHYAVMESDVAVMQSEHGKVSGHVLTRTRKARERVTRLIDEIVEEASCAAV